MTPPSWFAWWQYNHWYYEVHQCLCLAIPLALTQIARSANGFVDTAMLGMLGSNELAAGGLGAMLFTFLWLLGISILGAINPLIAAAHGAGRAKAIGQLVEQGIWLALLLSIPMTWVLAHPRPFLLRLGQEAEAIELVVPYLRAIAWGYFPALIFAVQGNFVVALSRPKSLLAIMVGAIGVNAMANYGLMFGKWGLPNLGIEGVGLASAITYWCMAIAIFLYIISRQAFHPYCIFTTLHHLRPQLFGRILALGLPIGAMALFEIGLFTMSTILAGQLGLTTLAAHQISLQTVALTFMVPLGISQAATVRVGQYWGQSNWIAARRSGYVSLGLGAIFMGMMAIVLLLFPKGIIGLYLDIINPENETVVQQAIALLAIGGLFQLADGVQVIATGALRGLQDTKIPMIIGITAYWGAGLTISYLAAFTWGWGGIGLWTGLACGLAIAAVWLTWRFHHRIAKSIVMSQ